MQQAEAAAVEPPVEAGALAEGESSDTGEDISMEDVLGGGTKKQPAAAKANAEEVPQVETQTY